MANDKQDTKSAADDVFDKIIGNNGGEERVVQFNEFWRPETEGEFVVGRVVGWRVGTIQGDTVETAELAGVVVANTGGHAKGYAGFDVTISRNLARTLTKDMVGSHVAIVYLGMQKNPKGGKDYKGFRVATLTEARWRELVSKLTPDHPALTAERAPTKHADGLPF